jgi:hypothetical protein
VNFFESLGYFSAEDMEFFILTEERGSSDSAAECADLFTYLERFFYFFNDLHLGWCV